MSYILRSRIFLLHFSTKFIQTSIHTTFLRKKKTCTIWLRSNLFFIIVCCLTADPELTPPGHCTCDQAQGIVSESLITAGKKSIQPIFFFQIKLMTNDFFTQILVRKTLSEYKINYYFIDYLPSGFYFFNSFNWNLLLDIQKICMYLEKLFNIYHK